MKIIGIYLFLMLVIIGLMLKTGSLKEGYKVNPFYYKGKYYNEAEVDKMTRKKKLEYV